MAWKMKIPDLGYGSYVKGLYEEQTYGEIVKFHDGIGTVITPEAHEFLLGLGYLDVKENESESLPIPPIVPPKVESAISVKEEVVVMPKNRKKVRT